MPSQPASNGDDPFTFDYVNPDHIAAFEAALKADDDGILEGPDTSPRDNLSRESSFYGDYPGSANLLNSPHATMRVRKISALSDFAPINTRVSSKKRRRAEREGKHSEIGFLIFRWPLLLFLFLWIFGEFGLYVLIRQAVNTIEWLFQWSGRKGHLRRAMRNAKTYDEWKAAAKTMDEYMGFTQWKKVDSDPFYDWTLVKKVRKSLKAFREKDDARGVLGVLEVCCRANFAGTESARLYSQSFYGTKTVIETYLDEVVSALEYIRKTPKLTTDEKRRFFKTVHRNLGSSALCLSGGASFGYYHIGLVKAFLDANLLPRVIAGTSAGGLIAALVGTRTDDELRELLIPRLADRLTSTDNEPFLVWFNRFLKTGARFDSVTWAKKACWFTRGSLTFREAYERTGRVLNVSVIPSDRHSPTKLLNYLTAPDCLIFSALLASAAVPGILNPVVLMQKTRTGAIIPWSYGSRFKDGSLRVDIPLQSLNLLFNVNFPVVSQVNPHIHLFFFAPRGSAGKPVAHRKGKGWRGGFILSAAEQYLKHDLTKNFKVIRDLELLPQLLGQDWSSVWLQRFDGVVTIWPRTRPWDWTRLLSDPDHKELERMMHVGQIAAFPKLHMIENRAKLEKEIAKGRRGVRRATRNKSPLPATRLEENAESANAAGSSDARAKPFPRLTDALAMESDVETAFARGEEALLQPKPYRSPRISLNASFDQLHEHGMRRRHGASTTNPRSPTSPTGAASPTLVPPTTPRNSGFFARLKRTSMSSFSAPFNSIGRARSKSTVSLQDEEGPWSSDSSSMDDDLFEPDMSPQPGRAEWDAAQGAFPPMSGAGSASDDEADELVNGRK